jgi:hypothetical protein
LLRDFCGVAEALVSLGQIADRFGGRAFGALLFVLAIPNLLPLPPGSTTVLGFPLLILAPQVALGLRRPWLPRFLYRRPIRRADLKRAFDKVIPILKRIETVSSPRLTFLFGSVGDRLIGLVCTALALVLILPIPLGNLAPSIALALFGLSLALRDGLLAIATYALTAGCAWLMVVGVRAGWAALTHLLGVVGWL